MELPKSQFKNETSKKAGYRVVHHCPNLPVKGIYPVCMCGFCEGVSKPNWKGSLVIWCINCGDYLSFAQMDGDVMNWQQFIFKYGDIIPRFIVNEYNDSLPVDNKEKKKIGENGKMQIEIEEDYVTSEFAAKNPKFVILNEGEYQDDKFARKEGGKKLNLTVKAGGKQLFYTPNKTSLKYLVKTLGKESKAWIGKPLEWEVVQQVVDGEKVQVVYVKGSLKESTTN